MANILDRYGIKEVADVTFYHIDNQGAPDYPVLYLDTLKVSTIEQTAEETDARGGKGNAALISWDYGKEITVTLEDALFSAKSMAIMFGNGQVRDYIGEKAFIMKTEQFIVVDGATDFPGDATTKVTSGWEPYFRGPDGKKYKKVNPKFFNAAGIPIVKEALTDGTKDKDYILWADFIGTDAKTKYPERRIFCSFDLVANGAVIEVSANSFPGTYYVTGDTYARNETNGEDEFFQFIIPKAKVQSENTITLEAEGDPSVFSMNLKVMRPADGQMMKLVKYELVEDPDVAADAASDVKIEHNHTLIPDTVEPSGASTYKSPLING